MLGVNNFRLETDPQKLDGLLSAVLEIANSEKEALGFLPDTAYRDAVVQRRLIAMVGGPNHHEVGGFLLHGGVYPHARIQQIGVASQYRRTGVASALLDALISDLERQGFLSVKANVADDLIEANSFYSRHGFEALASKPGGRARKRRIIIRVRQLETDHLFSRSESLDATEALASEIRRRSAGEAPIYTFDLNIYFDLCKDREKSPKARDLFGAALKHQIRLVIAKEFVKELESASRDKTEDPILQMALKLPHLPSVDDGELSTLSARIHQIVFTDAGGTSTNQSLSDARHLAHAALCRVSGFITRDKEILAARRKLLKEIGLDVASLEELCDLLPGELRASQNALSGETFSSQVISLSNFKKYLERQKVPSSVISEFIGSATDDGVRVEAIQQNEEVVAAGALFMPDGMALEAARLVIHTRAGHFDREIFADFLIDRLTRMASDNLPTMVELMPIPGQSLVSDLALSRGFGKFGSRGNPSKVTVGHPVTRSLWIDTVLQVRRRTGVEIVGDFQQASLRSTVKFSNGNQVKLSAKELEAFLSPTLVIWPNEDGVIVPITKLYASELLNNSNQLSLGFMRKRDAAFFSRRAYVNTPRSASLMRPNSPILFYESQRSGGASAIIAIARICDAVLYDKREIPGQSLRRLVVDKVDDFSSTEDVLVTTFENLFLLPSPVPFQKLKELRIVGGANLVTAQSISNRHIVALVEAGWPR